MKKVLALTLVIIIFLSLAACSSGSKYVGEYKSNEMWLTIKPDNTFAYENRVSDQEYKYNGTWEVVDGYLVLYSDFEYLDTDGLSCRYPVQCELKGVELSNMNGNWIGNKIS